jgi:SAM-dependent methyltransferase
MRIPESGMPEQALWESFFDPECILERMGLEHRHRDVVEFGCGYGTFTLPAARTVAGTVHAFDMDPGMLATARGRAADQELDNISFAQRDFMEEGTGLADGCADYAMVFNILHCSEPEHLLLEAYRNLRPGGTLAVIHWVCDRDTPRGPPLNIRPRPGDCQTWAANAGFENISHIKDLRPYHFGFYGLRTR